MTLLNFSHYTKGLKISLQAKPTNHLFSIALNKHVPSRQFPHLRRLSNISNQSLPLSRRCFFTFSWSTTLFELGTGLGEWCFRFCGVSVLLGVDSAFLDTGGG